MVTTDRTAAAGVSTALCVLQPCGRPDKPYRKLGIVLLTCTGSALHGRHENTAPAEGSRHIQATLAPFWHASGPLGTSVAVLLSEGSGLWCPCAAKQSAGSLHPPRNSAPVSGGLGPFCADSARALVQAACDQYGELVNVLVWSCAPTTSLIKASVPRHSCSLVTAFAQPVTAYWIHHQYFTPLLSASVIAMSVAVAAVSSVASSACCVAAASSMSVLGPAFSRLLTVYAG